MFLFKKGVAVRNPVWYMECFVKNPFECLILPGYFILLIIPGMTIINSGSILINPAIRVAPLAWEMLFAASNL